MIQLGSSEGRHRWRCQVGGNLCLSVSTHLCLKTFFYLFIAFLQSTQDT
jgi:hypothetical protein